MSFKTFFDSLVFLIFYGAFTLGGFVLGFRSPPLDTLSEVFNRIFGMTILLTLMLVWIAWIDEHFAGEKLWRLACLFVPFLGTVMFIAFNRLLT